MPVVKADAYRHGAVEVSRTLEAHGARWLAVSNTEEGVVLRDADIKARILVMADFLPFTRDALLGCELTPVLHSLADIAALDRLAVERNRRYAYHLKLDTGMGRLGVRCDAVTVGNAILAAKNVDMEGLLTHFASAGNYQTGQTDEQMDLFERTVAGLAAQGIHPKLLHMSSTIPVAYGRRRAWQGMVRPGHAIYGYVSAARGATVHRVLNVKPALVMASNRANREGHPGGRAGWVWGDFPCAAADAYRSARGGLRRWNPAPSGQPGQRHRQWQIRANTGRGVDGSDHYRCDPIARIARRQCRDVTRI